METWLVPHVAPSGPSAGGDAAPPVWDRSAFDDYTSWMPSHRIERVLALFGRKLSDACETLPGEPSNSVWERVAHEMISTAGMLGFVRLLDRSKAMQGAIRRGETPTASDKSAFLDALGRSREAVEAGVVPVPVPA